jgi:hypothetical protein
MRATTAALLVAAVLAATASAITTKIGAQSEECFSDVAPAGGTITIAFAVTHGGKLDIAAKVTTFHHDDDDKAVSAMTQNEPRVWDLASDGHFEFPVPQNKANVPGRMEICFSNKMARWTPKWINFEFYKINSAGGADKATTGAGDASEADDGITGEHNKEFQSVEQELVTQSHQVYDMHTKVIALKAAEQEHRDHVESTNSWILYGALVNGLLLAVMAAFQFWYLKHFLAAKNVSNMRA